MTKRLILLLIVVSLPACHKEYRANENIENLSGSNAKFGGIVGTAYDCFNKPLPYASLHLNKIPDSLKMKLNNSIFIARDMGFYNDEFLNIQITADSLGTYVFDSIPVGNYQVVESFPSPPSSQNGTNTIDWGVDTIQVRPDSFIVVHIEPIPPSAMYALNSPCGMSTIDIVSVKADSCAVVDIRLVNSWTQNIKPQIIWNPKYRPCERNLD